MQIYTKMFCTCVLLQSGDEILQESRPMRFTPFTGTPANGSCTLQKSEKYRFYFAKKLQWKCSCFCNLASRSGWPCTPDKPEYTLTLLCCPVTHCVACSFTQVKGQSTARYHCFNPAPPLPPPPVAVDQCGCPARRRAGSWTLAAVKLVGVVSHDSCQPQQMTVIMKPLTFLLPGRSNEQAYNGNLKATLKTQTVYFHANCACDRRGVV